MVAMVLHHQACQHESGMAVQSVEISNLRANLEIAKDIAHFENPQCICNGLYIVIVTTCLNKTGTESGMIKLGTEWAE